MYGPFLNVEKKYLNLSLHVDFHSVCTEDVSVITILWPCILLGARFEFQHIADNPDLHFCILQSPVVSANDTTKQDMTGSFYIIL
jgi:hypothetical protein